MCVCVCVCVCVRETCAHTCTHTHIYHGASHGGSVVKNRPAKAGDADLIPGSGISPGEENGNPLQYSCLGNAMDREAWWAI